MREAPWSAARSAALASSHPIGDFGSNAALHAALQGASRKRQSRVGFSPARIRRRSLLYQFARHALIALTVGLAVFAPILEAATSVRVSDSDSTGSAVNGLRIRDELGDEVPVVNERRRRRLHVEDESSASVVVTRWQVDNTDVATISRKGVVRGRNYGLVTVTAETSAGSVSASVVVVRVSSQGSAPVNGEARSDLSGAIYLSSPDTHVVYRSDGVHDEVFVGQPGTPGFADGTHENARLRTPAGLAIDQRANGGLYIAEVGNHCIRRVTPNGRTSVAFGFPTEPGRSLEVRDEEPATSSRLSGPAGVAVRGDDLIVADSANDSLVMFSAGSGFVRLLGGQPGAAGFVDGTGREARLDTPTGLAISTDGSLLAVADTGNDAVRLVALVNVGDGRVRGIVSTLGRASSGKGVRPSGGPDGTPIVFDDPKAVTFDGIGSVCVVDALGASVVTRPEGRLPAQIRLAESGSLGRPVAITVQGTRVLVLDGDALSRDRAVRVVEVGPPAITRAVPDVFAIEGGEEVVVDGANFSAESVVTLGDAVVEDLVIERSTRLRFRAPRSRVSGTRTLSIATRGGVVQIPVDVLPPSFESLAPGELTSILGGGLPNVGDGGLLEAESTYFQYCSDFAADSAGNVYVADGCRVRRIDAVTRIVTTVAGNGTFGYSGDGGPAVVAGLGGVQQIEVVENDLVILDSAGSEERIRRVDLATGFISLVVSSRSLEDITSIVASPTGQLLASFQAPVSSQVYSIERIDLLSGERIALVSGDRPELAAHRMLALSERKLLIAGNESSGRIWNVDVDSGDITPVAGGGESPVSFNPRESLQSRFGRVIDLVLDSGGSILAASAAEAGVPPLVFRADLAAGTVTAVAGGGTRSIGTRPIAAERVSLSVNALLVDVSGGVLLGVTDRILRLADGQVSQLTRVPPFFEPFASDGDTSRVSRYEPAQIAVGLDGRIVIAEDFPAPRVRVFDPETREIETIAGDGTVRLFRRSYDGAPALSVPLGYQLNDVAAGQDGSIYVAADERILRIVDGRVFLYAGNGEIALPREGPARDVPVVASAIAVSSEGTLYFVDIGDSVLLTVWRIRDGRVELVAGGKPGFGPASGTIDQLRFNGLEGLAVAPDGSLLVADPENRVIHRLDLAGGTYRREAGVGFGQDGCRIGDDCPAELSELVSPGLVVCSPSDHEFLSDGMLGVVELEAHRNLSLVTATSGARIELGASFEYGRPSLEYSAQVLDIAVDSSGNLYISDNLRKGLLVVRADNAHW